jgi:nucleoside 2-deoxyribosyltransferase
MRRGGEKDIKVSLETGDSKGRRKHVEVPLNRFLSDWPKFKFGDKEFDKIYPCFLAADALRCMSFTYDKPDGIERRRLILMRIYLAGPLFTEAGRAWMRTLKQNILDLAAQTGVQVEVLWPWEFVPQAELQSLGDQAGQVIFQSCISNLESADMVIALLDGTQVDDGTAWEIGYFYSMHRTDPRPIVGIRTDLRNAGECPGARVNAMIEYACDYIAGGQDEVIGYLFH